MLSSPSSAMSRSALSSSHQGASMPPANHEQHAGPSVGARSRTSTRAPRSASSTAQVSPATPAPATVTMGAGPCIRLLRRTGLGRYIDLTAARAKLLGHLAHPLLALARLRTHLVRDAHRAEFRSTHRAEMCHLVRLFRQRLIMERARGVRIERKVELIFPTEIEARPGERVIPISRTWVALCQVRSMRGDLVGDHAGFHIVSIGQPQMLLRRHVAEHRRAIPADHRCPDGRGDVVVARCDIRREGPEGVERRLPTGRELLVHVLFDLVHRDVTRSLDHDLTVAMPGDLRELPERLELGELCGIVCIRDGAGPQTVAEREAHVIRAADLADLLEMLVEETLPEMGEAPLRHDRAASRDDPRHAIGG